MLTRKMRVRCQLLALAVFVPVPVWAQTVQPAYPTGAVVQPLPPVDPLAANLKILAQNPYDVNALTQAGIGALEVGDPQAAIGFLARAEELSPNDPRIKAALGAALTQVERPQEALRTFAEAVSLGYLERLVLKDRGLAYDLVGDQKRAQKDYAAAEKQGGDAEIVRRHALSLGISGDKDAALKLLDPLVRRGDQSAWRARAFVLALNGDMPQADRIIRAATPPSMMGGMTAFLRRLPSLTAGQQASAVNFGTIPTTGPVYAAAEPTETFRSVGNGQMDGLLGASEPARIQTAAASAVKPSRAEIRAAERRERELAKLAKRGAVASGTVVASATPQPAIAQPVVASTPPPQRPVEPPRVQTAAVSQRVGQRIGPVDPSRLPPEMRVPNPDVRPTLVTGARDLPPPSPAPVQPVSGPAATLSSPPVKIDAAPVASPPIVQPSSPAVTPQPVKVASAAVSEPAKPLVSLPSPGPSPTVVEPPKPVLVATVSTEILKPAAPPILAPVTSPPVSTAPMASTPVLPAASADAPGMIQPTSSSAVVKPVDLPASTPREVLPPSPTVPVVPKPTEIAGPPTALATPAAPEMPKPAIVEPRFSPDPVPSTEPVKFAQADAPPTTPAATQKPADRLGSLLDGITEESESASAPLPSLGELRAQRVAAQKKADAEAKAKADKETSDKAEKELAAKKADEEAKAEAAKLRANPGRVWVQIATGANKSGLPITWKKLKEDAPKALSGMSPWFAPFRATHRLLVGPMKTPGEARQLVTALSREGVAATTWSSEPGQEVTRLGGR